MREASLQMHILWWSNIFPINSQFSSNLLITTTQNNYMPDQIKLKGKHKRGERGSIEEEAQQSSKQANMVDAELQLSNVNNEETLPGVKKKKPRQTIMPGRQAF